MALHDGERGIDLRFEPGGIVAVVVVIGRADFGGDGKTGRHRQTEIAHLGEVGALAPEQELLLLRAFFEAVDELGHGSGPQRPIQQSGDWPLRRRS